MPSFRRSGRCPDESDRGDWRGWHDQLDYFIFIKILSEERPDLPVLLERHGWTTGGFLSPPDRLLLLRDLQAIVGHGLGSYRKFKVEAPKEESLAGSLISDLIKSLEPETADGAV